MKTIYQIIFVSLALLWWSCGNKKENAAAAELPAQENNEVATLTQAQYHTADIEMGKVEMRTISGTVSASGMLDVPPQSKVTISAPMGGFVKSTNLLQGSRVSKGQVVVTMQHPDYIQLQQNYLENKGQLEFLEAEYERQKLLAKENVNAGKTLEKARADYTTAWATVTGLRAKLEMLNIDMRMLDAGKIQNTVNLYAPISGYVTKVNTNIGAFVNPTDVLFEIVNTEDLHAELTIFEKDVPLLKIGQRVLFTLSNENKHRVATVRLIGREINADRSVQVHCEIEKQDRELIPGLYLKAIVETDSAHVTALPQEAIVNFEGKSYIFVETGRHDNKTEAAHQFKMVEVGTGETELGYTRVILPAGFDLNAPVVIKGAFSILGKMKNSAEE